MPCASWSHVLVWSVPASLVGYSHLVPSPDSRFGSQVENPVFRKDLKESRYVGNKCAVLDMRTAQMVEWKHVQGIVFEELQGIR